MSVLEVWVGINTDPITVVNNSLVGTIDPGSPSIDVTNRSSAQSSTSNGRSNLLDVIDEGGRVSSDGGASSNTSG